MKADRETLTGISDILSAIIRDHKGGQPIIRTMAGRIERRLESHHAGTCETDCPYCSPEYVGLTVEDLDSMGDEN